jgi:hypothetical protein
MDQESYLFIIKQAKFSGNPNQVEIHSLSSKLGAKVLDLVPDLGNLSGE